MGKDAETLETREVKDAHTDEHLREQDQFKSEAFKNDQTEVTPYPYGDNFTDRPKDTFTRGEEFTTNQFEKPLKDSAPTFRGDDKMLEGLALEQGQPTGGFHGDKWNQHEGQQFKPSSEFTEATDAGGFHGDKWRDLGVKPFEPAKTSK